MLDAQGKIGSRIDYKTELKAPCYVVFIIEVSSIWVRKNTTQLDTIDQHAATKSSVTWGINFIVHAAQCLPSHLSIAPIPELTFLPVKLPQLTQQQSSCPPPPPPMPPITPIQPSFMDMYTKMLKMGIPRDAVKHKMTMVGIDPNLLDNSQLPSASHIPITLPVTTSLPPKITVDMLTGIKLKKSDDTPLQNTKLLKNIQKQAHGFEVKLDEILNIKSRLKKPKESGLPTYSSIFKPIDTVSFL
jgi:hypothetical protein